MPDSDDDVRDDDETILDNQSGEATEDGSGDEPGDSLTTSETSDPRKAFMEQYAADEPLEDSDDEAAASDDSEDEQEDDVSADDETPEDDADDSTSGDDEDTVENEDEDDETDVDIGVDLDDIEGVDDDEENVDEAFDHRQDLSKQVWTSTPKEAQQLITQFRRNYKHQQKQLESEKPYAAFTRDLLKDAATVGMQSDDLMAYIDLGLKAHQGHAEAIQALGSRMVQHGYQPALEKPDLSPVQDYLKQQVDSLELDREVATKILSLVNESAGTAAPSTEQRQAAPTQNQTTRERSAPDSSRSELESAAFDKIQEMDKRFQKRFGDDWPKLRERVRREVTLEMAENPVSPAQWAKIWKNKAEQEAKTYLKRSKSRRKKSRSKLRSNSDSLERGASIATKESGSDLSGRAAFHKQHSR